MQVKIIIDSDQDKPNLIRQSAGHPDQISQYCRIWNGSKYPISAYITIPPSIAPYPPGLYTANINSAFMTNDYEAFTLKKYAVFALLPSSVEIHAAIDKAEKSVDDLIRGVVTGSVMHIANK